LWLYNFALIKDKNKRTDGVQIVVVCVTIAVKNSTKFHGQERNSRVFDDVPVEATTRFVDASGMRDVVSGFRRVLDHCWIFFSSE
jgi:hypothetical protein